ncbi:hypothetical protein DOY81_005011 [Sarcophaga bullata]|nr:hypothetical protein DOY81_005011 [Sarcophaga bullata]
MAPTICSGKKRESRTILNSNIRRNGQGSHQLNQTLSNIVNYVAKGSLNSRVSTSLRIRSQSDKRNGDTIQRQQQISFLSDNAVTSSAHLDTENSFDLRLANDSTSIYGSNTNSFSTSPSSSSSSPSLLSSATETEGASHNERISSTTSPYEERRFQRYLSVDGSSGNDGDNKDSSTITKQPPSQIHSSNMRRHYFDCNDIDLSGDEDDDEEEEELNNHDISDGNDADMDTDEADSMTSLDTEKSAKLKRGNHPLLRDKLLAKHQTDNSNRADDDYRKPLANIRNSTDGLLSIAIKTIKLVKRNQLLQQRLTQLQLETSEFIQSVLANPENRHFRENIKQCNRQKVDKV